ncbi:Cof-type HAD-IIB family hydrolase [uncultured Duncaniella sp.]|uniref:Cof-type HAD-IIB family hydrolase n=1 Tax=uncultured Duncaniella sp. TaxID=2768039 RepID=UPI0026135590|nr:Cof-type HAD-IIB family hydrolase [uncultured Duncaniella sp.]
MHPEKNDEDLIMIKAVFFDIDGTLVPIGSGRVPADTRRALAELRAKGVKVFISSGRHIEWIDNLGDLEFDGYVTVNGALCLGHDGRTPIFTRLIDKGDVERLVDFSAGSSMPFVVVPARGGIFTTAIDDNFLVVAEMLHLPQVPVRSIEDAKACDVVQMMVFGSHEEIEASGLFRDVLTGCEPTSWCPYFADIIPKGSDKSVGIDRMIEHFGIDISETMAFGDGENDMGMLEHVGLGVAMGNALPEVKAVADYVTADADDDGIGKALRHFGVI